MNLQILLQIVLIAIALSMDAFAVAVTNGLTCHDLNKKKCLFIAIVFGLMQGIMPLIGFWFVELITRLVGTINSHIIEKALSHSITLISFLLLQFLGTKMLFSGIKGVTNPEKRETKTFSYKEILIMGVATSIDAMAAGITLREDIFVNETTWIWLHALIIIIITFINSYLGASMGHWFDKKLKGKYQISSIIGGAILIALSIWTLLESFAF